MPAYDTIQSWFDRFCAEGERSKNKMQWNNKLLIRYLIDNTRGHISHCTQTTLLAKYPRVLSTETPNKVYLPSLLLFLLSGTARGVG